MITPDVARAHIDEMRRVAARHNRAAGLPARPWRRLLTRSARRG